MNAPTAVLIFDADCPVCRAAADWVRRNAAVPDAFEYLPCRSGETRARFTAIAEAACLQAMHLVLPDGAILTGEQALPEILRRTRRYRWAVVLFRLPGAGPLSRFLYRAFARRRHRIARLLPPG
jgi:predicted DCC family thiol-disulfide oxidoreductase YuxK